MSIVFPITKAYEPANKWLLSLKGRISQKADIWIKILLPLASKQYIADHCHFLIQSYNNCYVNYRTKTYILNALTNDYLVFHISKIIDSVV